MGTLLPCWGESAQSGKSYYYQKLLHNIIGVLNLSNGFNMVYLIDETMGGQKNSTMFCHVLCTLEINICVRMGGI